MLARMQTCEVRSGVYVPNAFLKVCAMSFRVTSLEQFNLAEFSGEQARPKVYENEHKNVPGIWFDSITKVRICKNLSF